MINQLSTTEVADELRCSKQFVRNLIKEKQLKATKIGNTWVINRNDLNKWIKKSNYIMEPCDHPRDFLSFLIK